MLDPFLVWPRWRKISRELGLGALEFGRETSVRRHLVRDKNFFELPPALGERTREVLRRCGNMSSATILFVLEEILKRPSGKGRERVCAVAFGPGLTVEMATMEAIFAPDAAGVGSAAALLLSPG